MNRRSFLKAIGVGVAGVCGVKALAGAPVGPPPMTDAQLQALVDTLPKTVKPAKGRSYDRIWEDDTGPHRMYEALYEVTLKPGVYERCLITKCCLVKGGRYDFRGCRFVGWLTETEQTQDEIDKTNREFMAFYMDLIKKNRQAMRL